MIESSAKKAAHRFNEWQRKVTREIESFRYNPRVPGSRITIAKARCSSSFMCPSRFPQHRAPSPESR